MQPYLYNFPKPLTVNRWSVNLFFRFHCIRISEF